VSSHMRLSAGRSSAKETAGGDGTSSSVKTSTRPSPRVSDRVCAWEWDGAATGDGARGVRRDVWEWVGAVTGDSDGVATGDGARSVCRDCWESDGAPTAT
jgi:hypothetical protein